MHLRLHHTGILHDNVLEYDKAINSYIRFLNIGEYIVGVYPEWITEMVSVS